MGKSYKTKSILNLTYINKLIISILLHPNQFFSLPCICCSTAKDTVIYLYAQLTMKSVNHSSSSLPSTLSAQVLLSLYLFAFVVAIFLLMNPSVALCSFREHLNCLACYKGICNHPMGLPRWRIGQITCQCRKCKRHVGLTSGLTEHLCFHFQSHFQILLSVFCFPLYFFIHTFSSLL